MLLATRVLGVMVPLLAFLSVTIPIFCDFFFLFANGAVWSSCTFFFYWPIVLWFWQNYSMGDGSYPGWNLCFFCLKCGCLHRGNWPICPGFEQIYGGWYGVTLWGVLSDLEGWGIGHSFRLLPLLGWTAAGGLPVG